MKMSIVRLSRILLLVPLALPAFVPAQESTVGRRVGAPLEEFLARASDCERKQLWHQAAEIYERALRLYPRHDDLHHRWHKAERRYSLSRRYHDASFVDDLLRLSERDALELFDEVLRKIDSHYVEAVDVDRLVRMGYRNLDLALGERIFVDRHFPRASKAEIAWLRGELAKRPVEPIRSTRDAGREALHAGRLCCRAGASTATPIILEFLTSVCEELDPYTTHLSPNRLGDLYAMIDGAFVGLGIEVRGDAEGLLVVNVLPESPAATNGLTVDDRITAVDGKPLAGMNSEEAANLLQGAAETTVHLLISNASGAARSASIVRREVTIHSVTHARILDRDQGVGYARLSSFQKLTVEELEQAVAQLQRQGMRRLILDLRGNPGGLLDVAVKVANHFIDKGVLVSTKGRSWGQNWSHRARRMEVWRFPLVVLIDGDSASASEILAGAIQGHHRGTLVGSRTYGKGSVQSIYPLRSASTGLRLTTAKFYSPDGSPYDRVGVSPDVLVERPAGPLGELSPLPPTVDPGDDGQLSAALRVISRPLAVSERP